MSKANIRIDAVAAGIALLIAATGLASAAEVISEEIVWNGHGYVLVSEGSWNEVEDLAVSLGGHLVAINSQEEYEFVHSTFCPLADAVLGENLADLWIGLYQTNPGSYPRLWAWSNGDPFGGAGDYDNWCINEPNNCSNEYYGMMWGTRNPAAYCWNNITESGDGGCGDGPLHLFGVIEFDPPIPVEATPWGSLKARFRSE